MSENADRPLLEVKGLTIAAVRDGGAAAGGATRIVEDVGFTLRRGETLAVVGESGCGKSLTALSLLRLLDPPLEVLGGSILLEGKDLLRVSDRELRKVRGGRIAMVFQEPMTALNPVLTIGEQIEEVLVLHRNLRGAAARARAAELLREVAIPDPEAQLARYPHQFSGGMRQRAMLAMALAGEPEILIADEPTTALDVTVQAQILDLLRELQQRRGLAILLITHDLGVVAETAHRVLVMYAGRVVEEADADALFERPQHPYTAALFRARPGAATTGGPAARLAAIRGAVPAPAAFPPGCRFHPRCDEALPVCAVTVPGLLPHLGQGAAVACHARHAEPAAAAGPPAGQEDRR